MLRRQALSAAVGGVLASGAWTSASARSASVRPAPLPVGYAVVARAYGIPPLILYGVALQESKMRFGEQALPYPWTLCVRGTAMRFRTYEATVAHLRTSVANGITNVDCGCMQVNWHYHHARLGTFWRALDPYPNLQAGASILRDLHAASAGNWFAAVGQYHTGPIRTAEQRERAQRYATATFARLRAVPATWRDADRLHPQALAG